MAKYILNSYIYLRSYADHPRCVYDRRSGVYYDVSRAKFKTLFCCDGKSDIEADSICEELVSEGLIRPSSEGERLSEPQKYRFCANIRLSMLNLEITERCNYNCRHCFNAEGIKVPRAELTIDEIKRILDQAFDCGVNNVVLTGGEPMLHPHFMDIIRYVSEKGMNLIEINTNGSLITREMLEEFQSLGVNPLMKISFDGVGFHNWMRGMDETSLRFSAEQNALSVMRLLVSLGFRVFVQMNLNKKNLGCIPKSIDLLDDIGVYRSRIIRTSEAPRWIENGADATLSWSEYFDACLDIAEYYLSRERKMSLIMWQFLFIHSKKKLFFAEKITAPDDRSFDDRWLCGERLDICANGELYPCMQMSGWLKSRGISLGNIKKTSLEELLNDSPYLKFITCTKEDKRCNSTACRECPFFAYCGGGCPALSVLTQGSYYGRDGSSCIFFRDGYYEKIKALMPDFRDMRPMNDGPDKEYLKRNEIKKAKQVRVNSTDHMELLRPIE